MKYFGKLVLIPIWISFLLAANTTQANDRVEQELDAYWAAMSLTVEQGDIEAYSALYHSDAILVNGMANKSYSIKKAIAGWKHFFSDTQSGKISASVNFRFSKRLHNDTTAHETGMFNYQTVDANGKKNNFIANINALFVKKGGKWLMMMEYQKNEATLAEWDKLKK